MMFYSSISGYAGYLVYLLGLFCALPVTRCSSSSDNPAGLNFCTEFEETISKFRVIGGAPADTGNFSFYALFYSFDVSGYGQMCGATVLNDRWLLTAAHCVPKNVDHAFVRVGLTTSDDYYAQRAVSKTIIHAGFSLNDVRDDIALVQTTHRIPLGKHVSAVCLSRNDDNILSTADYGTVVGFGVVVDKVPMGIRVSTGPSKILEQTKVSLLSPSKCSRQTFSSDWFRLSGGVNKVSTKKQLCAGDLFHGTAPGDSGGPLLVSDLLGNTVQVGITSFGANGLEGIIDQSKYPGVYTRVSSYIPWIEALITENSSAITSQLTCFLLIGVSILLNL